LYAIRDVDHALGFLISLAGDLQKRLLKRSKFGKYFPETEEKI